MAINFKKIWGGLTVVPKTASSSDSKGELEVIDSTGKLQYHNGTTVSPVITESHTATITNKTIDADDNTISDLETDNLKAGVLNIDLEAGPATDTEIPSALAVQTLVDNSIGSIGTDVADLVTLTGVPANSTDLGTFTGAIIPDASDIKEALQALETAAETDATNLANHLSDATDAHDASAISFVPTGTIAATDVQAAVAEVASEAATNLATHESDTTSVHGIADTSILVTTTGSQTLTNKIITGADFRTPIRSDVKQDTGANLTTYAATASNGQLAFATDTKIMYQVIDSALVTLGSLPSGGTTGQVLAKASNADGDVEWIDIDTLATPAVEIAGVSIPLSSAIILNACTSGTSNYQALRRNGTAYQVPSGKKLIIVAVKPTSTESATNNTFIGYGDAAATGASPSGAVTMNGGGANQSNIYLPVGQNNGGHVIYLEVAASKYPYVLGPAASLVVHYTVLAYLEDV